MSSGFATERRLTTLVPAGGGGGVVETFSLTLTRGLLGSSDTEEIGVASAT